MDAGKQTVEWLYSEQLKVDDRWAVRTPDGFRWWADKHAQTIEVIGQDAAGPDWPEGYFVAVSTELLRSVDMDHHMLSVVNEHLMMLASMSGPVYYDDERLLSLCSLVRVSAEISPWLNPLIGMASVLQLSEARLLSSRLASLLDAEVAISGHPANGLRAMPDELMDFVGQVLVPTGRAPSRWPAAEFEEVVHSCVATGAAPSAELSGVGFTVKVPCGGEASLCEIRADVAHPYYGSGLFLLQHMPLAPPTESEGVGFALALNDVELTQAPLGYGFGSYAWKNGMIYFTSFLPNALYRPGLLPNVYASCVQRAAQLHAMFSQGE